MAAYTVSLFEAAADGISPAALLSFGDKGPQYLFNAPEGFSRLALEHKLRPSARLQAVCALRLRALGGIAGLIMRLREDGHGELQMCGPHGMVSLVHGLRHFVRWRHPRLLLKELTLGSSAPTFYEDAHVAIAALFAHDDEWQPPAWLLHPAPAQQPPLGTSVACTTAQANSSSTSSDSDSEAEEAEANSYSETSTSSDEDSTRQQGSAAVEDKAEQRAEEQPHLKECAARRLDAVLGRKGNASMARQTLLQHYLGQELAAHRTGGGTAPGPFVATAEAAGAAPGRGCRQNPASGVGKTTSQPCHALHNSQGRSGGAAEPNLQLYQPDFVPLEDSSNPIFERRTGPAPQQIESTAGEAEASGCAGPCALLCYAKASNGLLLFLDCPDPALHAAISSHPAVQLLLQQQDRMLTTLHLTLPAARDADYRQWAHTLPGKQVFVGKPEGAARQLGYLASARTLAKLNVISPAFFPLPPALAPPPSGAPPLDSQTSVAAHPATSNGAAEPGNREAGKALEGGLLAQLRVSSGGAALDESACPASVSPGEVKAELLEQRPALQPLLDELRSPQAQPAARPSQATSMPLPTPGMLPTTMDWHPAGLGQPRQLVPGLPGIMPDLAPWDQPPPVPGCASTAWLPFGFPGPLSAPHAAVFRPPVPCMAAPLPPGLHTPRPPAHPPAPLGRVADEYLPPVSGSERPCVGKRPSGGSAGVDAAKRQKVDSGLKQPQPDLVRQGGASQSATNKAAAAALRSRLLGAAPSYVEVMPADSSSDALQLRKDDHTDVSGRGDEKLLAEEVHAPALSSDTAFVGPESSALLAHGGQPLQRGVAIIRQAAVDAPRRQVAPPTQAPRMPPCLQDMARRGDKALVLFLGTGCAEPSKYRGSSGIHVRLDSGLGLLLDAGEGAWGGLIRHYGLEQAKAEVSRLCAVWVSHKHADHMLGLPALLQARSDSDRPLLVIGPEAAQAWLAEAAGPLGLRYHFVHCSRFDTEPGPARPWLLQQTGLTRWQSVRAEHCHDAWGLALAHRAGWSLVYSGDSRPCARLQAAGRGCTLLIHEATFEPGLAAQAIQKRHSTTEEALRLAARMGAYRIILTHFSSRYPKVPVGLPAGGPLAEMAGAAHDGMRVPLALLPWLPGLLPVVTAALGEPGEEGDGNEARADGGG